MSERLRMLNKPLEQARWRRKRVLLSAPESFQEAQVEVDNPGAIDTWMTWNRKQSAHPVVGSFCELLEDWDDACFGGILLSTGHMRVSWAQRVLLRRAP